MNSTPSLPTLKTSFATTASIFAARPCYAIATILTKAIFFKYFALNFNQLGLKKLIATCYDGSPVQGKELVLFCNNLHEEPRKAAYKVEITAVDDVNGDGAIDLSDVRWLLQNDCNAFSLLDWGGDFRHPKAKALLQEADIVVTNPPFSLFREYVAQLMEYDKNF